MSIWRGLIFEGTTWESVFRTVSYTKCLDGTFVDNTIEQFC